MVYLQFARGKSFVTSVFLCGQVSAVTNINGNKVNILLCKSQMVEGPKMTHVFKTRVLTLKEGQIQSRLQQTTFINIFSMFFSENKS